MEQIKLGLLAPLTGLVKLYGNEICWAAQIACDEINRAGGIQGRPLELVIEDDGSLPLSAVPAAEKLVKEHHCTAIIGNLLSNSRIAVANHVAEPLKIPMLNFSFYEGSISAPHFFSFAALPNQQIEKVIPYIVKHFGPKVFFAGNNCEWPRGSIDAAKRTLLENHGEVVGEEYFKICSDDFHDLLIQVKNSGADVFFPYAAGIDQINLLNQFTAMGLKERMKVVMSHYNEAMVQALSPEVREGCYSSNTYFMSLQNPFNQHYLEQLQQQPGVNGVWPNGNGVLTNFGEGVYLCVLAFAKAANQVSNISSQNLIKALETISIEGPQGSVNMDPATHNAHLNSYLACCNKDGSFEIIKQFGRITPEIPPRYRATQIDQISELPAEPEKPLNPSAVQLPDSSQDILHLIDVAVIAINHSGNIIKANRCASQLFGYEDGELIGLNMNLLIPPHLRANYSSYLRSLLNSKLTDNSRHQYKEISCYKKDGSFFPAKSSINKLSNEHGTFVIFTMSDITEQQREQELLLWKATHDPLTKLPNRTLILDRLENSIARAKRTGDVIAVIFIDVDEFKLVNDNHGHEIGDQLLIEISHRLLDAVRPGDTVARFGGDEFVVLCDQINSSETLPKLAERILDTIKEQIIIDDIGFYPSVSIGISIGNSKSDTHELLRGADAAMYRVKAEGRDGWQIFNDIIRFDNRQQLDIISGLRGTIERNELSCYLQPIVDINTLRIVGAEALMRWEHDGKFISPALFIPIAEKSGIVEQIGHWIFAQACRQQVAWQNALGAEAPYISINLSARQLQRHSLVEEFMSVVDETGIDPNQIVLEITETTLMSDIDNATRLLKRFGQYGIRLAIDDFGTGHSSLSRIHQLPVKIIKVDQAFIRHIEQDQGQYAITTAVIEMAHHLKLKVTAEGVETAEHLEILDKINCNSVQGYYFNRPMPADEFHSLLVNNNGHYQIERPYRH